MPVISRDENGTIKYYKRNTRLYVPRDFDTSPYFEIIKYPLLGLDDLAVYRYLPWDMEGVVCNDNHECFIPNVDGVTPITVGLAQSYNKNDHEPGSVAGPSRTNHQNKSKG